MNELMEIIGKAARGAGEIMRAAADSRIEIESKEGHANFVTEYDRRIQDYLFSRLSSEIPGAHFLGEENGRSDFKEEDIKGLTFVIDPIDGTSNFMKGNFPSVTSIGLLRDAKPYIGVVYNPFSDQLFSAEAGKGAFENNIAIHSSLSPLSESLVTLGTAPYYDGLSDVAFRLAADYIKRSVDIRRSGSAEWDLCMVASGRIGMYFEPLIQIWDYCAGALICAEAGGTVTDFGGRPLSFKGPSSIVAASEGVAREGNYLPDKLTGK